MISVVCRSETEAEQIAELDARWKAIEGGEETISHDEVLRWLETWGTPTFRPWRDRLDATHA